MCKREDVVNDDHAAVIGVYEVKVKNRNVKDAINQLLVGISMHQRNVAEANEESNKLTTTPYSAWRNEIMEGSLLQLQYSVLIVYTYA